MLPQAKLSAPATSIALKVAWKKGDVIGVKFV